MLKLILRLLHSVFRTRQTLILENGALHHQIEVLQRNSRQPTLLWRDRAFWDILSTIWPGWRSSLYIVQPEGVVRDRDGIYGSDFEHRVASMGIEQIRTAERSPWQNPYVERVIGSIRRECLDYVIIFNQRHLRRVLCDYLDYYHRSRTHLGLEKDCPVTRPAEPIDAGDIQTEPIFGGLHHRYSRKAA